MDNTRAIELLESHKNGTISDEAFLYDFGKETVFYSTPFGDHKDGSPRLFILPGPDKTAFNPVFTSAERLREFYEGEGRVNYVMMNGSFLSVLEVTNGINAKAPVKMGLVIDPGYYGVTVPAGALNQVIALIK